jgi:hypothetical protein
MITYRETKLCHQQTLLLLPPPSLPPPPSPRRNTGPTPSNHGMLTNKSSRLISIPSNTTTPDVKNLRKIAQRTLWFFAMKLRALRVGIGRLVGPPRIAPTPTVMLMSAPAKNILTESHRFVMI